MRYITFRQNFYAACDAMVLMYTQYPTITPVTEEQIEDDLITYLKIHGAIADDLDCTTEEILEEDGLKVVDPQIIAPLILQDVKEALQHV